MKTLIPMKFIIPTLKQVTKQFQLKEVFNNEEPLKFMAHYESNGWMVGKTPMKSWKAAVSGWCLRINQFNPTKTVKTSQFPDYYSKKFENTLETSDLANYWQHLSILGYERTYSTGGGSSWSKK